MKLIIFWVVLYFRFKSYFGIGLFHVVVMKVCQKVHPSGWLMIVHVKSNPPNLLHRKEESPDWLNDNAHEDSWGKRSVEQRIEPINIQVDNYRPSGPASDSGIRTKHVCDGLQRAFHREERRPPHMLFQKKRVWFLWEEDAWVWHNIPQGCEWPGVLFTMMHLKVQPTTFICRICQVEAMMEKRYIREQEGIHATNFCWRECR
jgi:hypothetical protein